MHWLWQVWLWSMGLFMRYHVFETLCPSFEKISSCLMWRLQCLRNNNRPFEVLLALLPGIGVNSKLCCAATSYCITIRRNPIPRELFEFSLNSSIPQGYGSTSELFLIDSIWHERLTLSCLEQFKPVEHRTMFPRYLATAVIHKSAKTNLCLENILFCSGMITSL